ncbi:MAG TPA: ABC transporter ATP-binding protein [Candidatus Acidoferrales bacterium]|nr:ABC transporter ATP-binding protein [Candidatus Acidoferrales bacterium]
MNGNATVIASDLTRRFGSFVAVDGISFEIHSGEIWGFLGPNGAGKSTTIRMLCGVLRPTSGSAHVLGYDVARDPESVKLRIGYMAQGSSLWNDLTVEEHLRVTAGLFGLWGRVQRDAIEEWMARIGLTERRRELVGSLPGGFRKRVALACALVHRPQMIFLDEPTSGVDPVSRREFWDIIVDLADQGTTVMVTTHYLDEAEHCNQLAFIYGGRIIARGSPEALKRAPGSGVTIELITSDNIAALDVLEKLTVVKNATLYGSTLHVTIANDDDAAQLRKLCDERGLGVRSWMAITPSLEDVFAGLVKAA